MIDRDAEVRDWLAYRGLPAESTIRDLIDHERTNAALAAVFDQMRKLDPHVAAVLDAAVAWRQSEPFTIGGLDDAVIAAVDAFLASRAAVREAS